ncbi:hypothetical protein [Arthrobacter sp. N199823]|uniref:hypothetical protein n=1 Tax=Arthrobacter sp. N199823 TaxID=2058895 RepID=UPI000CE346C8|nr:hypothetical protein [Arthrobacter sp. N199823]
MTKPIGAANSLNAVDLAQQRAHADVRWFPWACILMGLLVIPGGLVVPWDWPMRLYVFGSTLALMFIVTWLMGRRRAMPRGGKNALNVSVGCWLVLNAAIGAVGGDIESLGLGLVFSTVASAPFFITAAKFHSGAKAS